MADGEILYGVVTLDDTKNATIIGTDSNGKIIPSPNTYAQTSVNINTTSPLGGGGNLSADRTITIAQSSTSANGYLSSVDWNIFNNKISKDGSTTTTAPVPFSKGYYTGEVDNGNVNSTATIDWSLGNVQYATMTGATTFSFTNPQSGMRLILHLAGAFTPTLPSTVRWPAGTTPTWTATSGKKDIVSLVYSGKESLYDAVVAQAYATT